MVERRRRCLVEERAWLVVFINGDFDLLEIGSLDWRVATNWVSFSCFLSNGKSNPSDLMWHLFPCVSGFHIFL